MPTPRTTRRASSSVALSASFLLLAGGLAACGNDTEEYQAVCINPQNQERIADRYCDDDYDGGYLGFTPVPYYYGPGYDGRYAGVGQRVRGGTRNLPKSTSSRGVSVGKGNVSTKGGSAAKAVRGGGFGGGAKSSS